MKKKKKKKTFEWTGKSHALGTIQSNAIAPFPKKNQFTTSLSFTYSSGWKQIKKMILLVSTVLIRQILFFPILSPDQAK